MSKNFLRSQRGMIPVVEVLIIVGLIAIGAAVYYTQTHSSTKNPPPVTVPKKTAKATTPPPPPPAAPTTNAKTADSALVRLKYFYATLSVQNNDDKLKQDYETAALQQEKANTNGYQLINCTQGGSSQPYRFEDPVVVSGDTATTTVRQSYGYKDIRIVVEMKYSDNWRIDKITCPDI